MVFALFFFYLMNALFESPANVNVNAMMRESDTIILGKQRFFGGRKHFPLTTALFFEEWECVTSHEWSLLLTLYL
jgi:hypothetical protein